MVLTRTRQGCIKDDFDVRWARGANGGLSMGLCVTRTFTVSLLLFQLSRPSINNLVAASAAYVYLLAGR
ncbi:hypothetical protein L218DRAFT_967668 [Marasmius fiardii PR-910]|nr:hypothetical protein L218DRAFT_967668 [Marasmius fiardii PR-910]